MDKEHFEGGYEGAKGAVKSGVGNLAGDPDREAEGLSDRVEGAIHERVGDLRDTVRQAAASAQETLRPLSEEIEARIQRNPTGSVLIAAGVGLAVALILGRR